MKALTGCKTTRTSVRAFREAIAQLADSSSGTWAGGQYVRDPPPKISARPTGADALRILDWIVLDRGGTQGSPDSPLTGRPNRTLLVCEALAYHHGLNALRLRIASCDGRMVVCWLSRRLRRVKPDNPAQCFLDDLPRVLNDLKAGILPCEKATKDPMLSQVLVCVFNAYMAKRPAKPLTRPPTRTRSVSIPGALAISPSSPSFKDAFFLGAGTWTPGLDALIELLKLFCDRRHGGPYVPGDPSTEPDVKKFFDTYYPDLSHKKREVIYSLVRPPTAHPGRKPKPE